MTLIFSTAASEENTISIIHRVPNQALLSPNLTSFPIFPVKGKHKSKRKKNSLMIRGKVTLLFPFFRAFPLENLSSENSSSVPLRHIYLFQSNIISLILQPRNGFLGRGATSLHVNIRQTAPYLSPFSPFHGGWECCLASRHHVTKLRPCLEEISFLFLLDKGN